MLAIVAVAGALTGAAHAQMGAVPRDAAAKIVDAARQARLGVSHYGMVDLDPANLALIEVVDSSRRRAAGAMMGLAAVTAIEPYPPLLPQIDWAAVDMAPDFRDDIVRRFVLVFPLQAAS
jgi:hypothetical protein